MAIKVSILSNGLRVATDVMAEAESTVIGAFIGVGTRHEPWAANGVAHLVEHMLFKGTKRRSAFSLATTIEKNGGMMNAYTTREETAYYARVLPEDAELACDIVADMLQNSLLNAKELERERQVIIQEIGRDRDTAEDFVFDLLHKTAFPKQRIGRPILGSAKTIAHLPRHALKEYLRHYYHAGNMVIIGAGRITHQAFVEMVQKRLGCLPMGKPARSDKARVKDGATCLEKPIEQLHLILGFAAPGAKSPALPVAQLLGVLLGGTSSSRLFQKVREKRGLVYTVNAGHYAFCDTGLFGIYAGSDPKRVKELIPVICAELKDVKRHVSPSELKRAKAQMRADLLMGQESVLRRAETLGHQMIRYGRPIAQATLLQKFNAVTVPDIEAMARKMFGGKPIVAALGPMNGVDVTKKIRDALR